MFSAAVALPASLFLLQNDLQPHEDFRDRINESAVEAIEDISVEGGILIGDNHIAVRNGDEFTIYGVVGTDERRAVLSRINDEDEALRIAGTIVQSYETYLDASAFERENNVDIDLNDNAREIDIRLLSQPYNINQEEATYIDAIGFEADEFTMDDDALNGYLNDWQNVYNSIADGGYENFDDSATLTATLPDVDNGDVFNNLLIAYGVFWGAAFLGGVGIVANRRREERTERYKSKDQTPNMKRP